MFYYTIVKKNDDIFVRFNICISHLKKSLVLFFNYAKKDLVKIKTNIRFHTHKTTLAKRKIGIIQNLRRKPRKYYSRNRSQWPSNGYYPEGCVTVCWRGRLAADQRISLLVLACQYRCRLPSTISLPNYSNTVCLTGHVLCGLVG